MSGLPDPFGVVLLVFSFILLLAPYFSGTDFGLFKIPTVNDRARKLLKVIGPILFMFCIFLFAPILPSNQQVISAIPSPTPAPFYSLQVTPLPSPVPTPNSSASPLPSSVSAAKSSPYPSPPSTDIEKSQKLIPQSADPVSVGYSGVYRNADVDGLSWLRFYEDGTAVGVGTVSSATPLGVSKWLTKSYENRGRYIISGSNIKFSLTSSAGTVDYSGIIGNGFLQLQIYSHINGYRATHEYKFVELL